MSTRLKWMLLALATAFVSSCGLFGGKRTDYFEIISMLKKEGLDSLTTQYISDYNFDVVALFRFGKSYSATDIFVFNADKSLKEYYFFPNDPEDTTRNAKALLVLKYRYEYGVNELFRMEDVRSFAIIMGDTCQLGGSGDELPGIFFDPEVKPGEVLLLFPLPFLRNIRVVNSGYLTNYVGYEVGNFPLYPIDMSEILSRFQPSGPDSLVNFKIVFNNLSVSKDNNYLSAFSQDYSIIKYGDCISLSNPRYD